MPRVATPDPIVETNAAGFEIETCGRCGGSGRYSFNAMDGDRCYGCRGSGKKYTKRGAQAYAFYRESTKRPAGEVQVGEFVRSSVSLKFRVVDRIDPPDGTHGTINGVATTVLHLRKAGACGYTPSMLVESLRNEEERLQKLAAALAHQASIPKRNPRTKR